MSDIRVKSQIRALKTELRDMKYQGKWSDKAVEAGEPSIFLQVLHFLIFDYNETVTENINVETQIVEALSDLEFAEYSFKILKAKFNYRPKLTITNFFKNGFAGQKVTFLKEVADLVHNYTNNQKK